MKSPEDYRNREQTYLKHFFLERYLEKVAFHIGYTHRSFVYVDCFSGPWQSADEDLADTSIRIALDKLNYVHQGLAETGRQVDIQAIFIEKNPSSFSELSEALQVHSHSIQSTALHGTFEENIPSILQRVEERFAFFFIDPKGWTGFAMDKIGPILRHKPGEVMVNFMYDFINRFINYPEAPNEQSLDRFFGCMDWRDIRNASDREAASVRKYSEGLRAVGAYPYLTSTRILKPLADRAYFHLVYATRSPKGILEFRRVEEKAFNEQDAVREAAQRSNRERRSGQRELLFTAKDDFVADSHMERAKCLEEARARVFALLKEGPMEFEQLQASILQIPLVWPKELNSILLEARKDGLLKIQGWAPRQRVPKPGNIVSLA